MMSTAAMINNQILNSLSVPMQIYISFIIIN